MASLELYSREQLLALTTLRHGESKLGEHIQTVSSLNDLPSSTCKFVLIGLPEDIGVRANFGIGGAHTGWLPALKSLVNIQSTSKFSGEQLVVLGHLDFSAEMALADQLDAQTETQLRQLRALVSSIDDHVTDLIHAILSAGKVPIVIGGGHNNSYPIIKAFAQHFQRPVNTINLDAHADFRLLEGRHSGNGFSYALKEGFLGKYAIVGLHENYNSQNMMDELRSLPKQVRFSFYEDFVRENDTHDRAFMQALNFTEGITGLEIDLDSITDVLSSAVSPTGFNVCQVRELIAQTKLRQFFYLHIAEGVYHSADGRKNPMLGKLIATLITDFIKAQL